MFRLADRVRFTGDAADALAAAAGGGRPLYATASATPRWMRAHGEARALETLRAAHAYVAAWGGGGGEGDAAGAGGPCGGGWGDAARTERWHTAGRLERGT